MTDSLSADHKTYGDSELTRPVTFPQVTRPTSPRKQTRFFPQLGPSRVQPPPQLQADLVGMSKC